MSSYEDRKAARQRTWQGGVAKCFSDMDDIDRDQWQAVPPVDRLKAMWSLVEDSLALSGEHGTTPRLQRLVGGVRRFKG